MWPPFLRQESKRLLQGQRVYHGGRKKEKGFQCLFLFQREEIGSQKVDSRWHSAPKNGPCHHTHLGAAVSPTWLVHTVLLRHPQWVVTGMLISLESSPELSRPLDFWD